MINSVNRSRAKCPKCALSNRLSSIRRRDTHLVTTPWIMAPAPWLSSLCQPSPSSRLQQAKDSLPRYRSRRACEGLLLTTRPRSCRTVATLSPLVAKFSPPKWPLSKARHSSNLNKCTWLLASRSNHSCSPSRYHNLQQQNLTRVCPTVMSKGRSLMRGAWRSNAYSRSFT